MLGCYINTLLEMTTMRATSPGLEFSSLGRQSVSATFDLTLSLEETLEDGESRVAGFIEYNTDLFDATTIGRLWRHYITLLEAVTADPERRLSRLPGTPR